ncbi:MAG: hypothetical protein WAV76_09865 [Bacteroidota bacterium]
MSIRTVTLQDLVEQAFEEEVLNGLAVFFENRLEKRPEAANLLEDDLALTAETRDLALQVVAGMQTQTAPRKMPTTRKKKGTSGKGR